MSTTRKLLVAFDPARPESQTSDFLVPWSKDGQQVLLGLKSGNIAPMGLMVSIGRPITENELFAKLVALGPAIANVDTTLSLLRSYLNRLQTLRIGNLVRVRSCMPANRDDFDLELIATTPSRFSL